MGIHQHNPHHHATPDPTPMTAVMTTTTPTIYCHGKLRPGGLGGIPMSILPIPFGGIGRMAIVMVVVASV